MIDGDTVMKQDSTENVIMMQAAKDAIEREKRNAFMRSSADDGAKKSLERLNKIIEQGRQTDPYKFARIITTIEDFLKMAQMAMDSDKKTIF